MRALLPLMLALVIAAGCTARSRALPPDAGFPIDAALPVDAGGVDAASSDAGPRDAATPIDAAMRDAAMRDAAMSIDAFRAPDTGVDAGRRDSGPSCVLGTVMCTGGYTADTYVSACAARELHVLGVYEPSPGSARIPVSVTRTGAALTIVVSSYESVSWDFTLAPGVNVERVILNGFDPQTATGLPSSVMVVDRSGAGSAFAACAYEWPVGTGGCATEMLIAGVESFTGLATTSFTGCYQAATFSVSDP